jgi:hypothetical protein
MPPRLRPAAPLAGLLAALLALTLAAPAVAQTAATAYDRRASVNLLGIPFGIASAEYEQLASSELSFGASAGFDSDNTTWGEGKVRYYPSARAPRAFAIGASAGIAQLRAYTAEDCFIFCADASGPTATGPTFGVFLDYSWLIGRSRRFYIGTGLGAKRIFGLEDSAEYEFAQVHGTGRLQIGYAF